MAPPMMAMTMNAEAFFARAPRPKMPRAKMVGNMIDMKKKLRKTHATESQPSFRKISRQATTFSAP